MADEKILANDDERIAFAAQLGWRVRELPSDLQDHEGAATEFFQRAALLEEHEAELEGVDQRVLDEVRDAVIRRARQSAPQPRS